MLLAVPPPEVLLPLGAGVAALVVALVTLLLLRRARRRRRSSVPTTAARSTVAEAVRAAERRSGPADVEPAPRPDDQAGSGRPMAAAVAQALAVREARARADQSTGVRGDARDRLLAVLLDDPVRAVGAAVELEACRRQLDRLGDAVRHERAALGDVLGRLSGAGLAPDQLARLSGLSAAELRLLMQEQARTR